MPTYYNPTQNIVSLPYSQNQKYRNLSINPGETLVTTYFVTTAEIAALGLTLSDVEPFAKISNSVTNLTFSGAGTQNVTSLIDSKILRVKSDVVIIIRANDVTNPYYYPLGSTEGFIDIRNDREIDTLYITASGAGSVWVVELRD